MAIANYTDLRAAIKSWLRRSDLDTFIPDFISLCEADLNARLRLSQMEVRTILSASSEYTSFVTEPLELRNIQINTNPVTALSYMSPQDMDRIYGGKTGKPLFYAIVADTLQLAPIPDGTYNVEIDYYASITGLATTATNFLLTKAPDIYLYGSLLHSAPYVHDDKRITIWLKLYERAMARIMLEDKMKIYSGSVLEMRPG